MNMFKPLINLFFTLVLFVLPQLIFAQTVPGFSSPGVCDTCAPIDQQTLLLASSGVAYAIHKIRESRNK